MPVMLGIDDSESDEEIVAVGPGTMRRKSPGEGKEWLNGAEPTVNGAENPSSRNGTSAPTKTSSRSRKR